MLQVFRLKFSNYFNIWLLRRYFGGLNLYDLSMGAMGPGTFAPFYTLSQHEKSFTLRLGAQLLCLQAQSRDGISV
jgi:hypothetical protein